MKITQKATDSLTSLGDQTLKTVTPKIQEASAYTTFLLYTRQVNWTDILLTFQEKSVFFNFSYTSFWGKTSFISTQIVLKNSPTFILHLIGLLNKLGDYLDAKHLLRIPAGGARIALTSQFEPFIFIHICVHRLCLLTSKWYLYAV